MKLIYEDSWRQGDVLIIRIADDETIEGAEIARKNKRIVLAEGETTGHAHVVAEPQVKWIEVKDTKERVLMSEVAFPVTHEEHDAHWFAPGQYLTVIQAEHDLSEMRDVLD